MPRRLCRGRWADALDRLHAKWRSAGLVPAADAAGLLAQYAHQLRAEGQVPAVVADQLEACAVPNRESGP